VRHFTGNIRIYSFSNHVRCRPLSCGILYCKLLRSNRSASHPCMSPFGPFGLEERTFTDNLYQQAVPDRNTVPDRTYKGPCMNPCHILSLLTGLSLSFYYESQPYHAEHGGNGKAFLAK
jgi:hypothetical protein